MNRQITDSVYYTGVDDNTTTLFESLWPLPYGVSYNSYLIKTDKTALIDTVEISRLPDFLKGLEENGIKTVDYIIINHMEPDHSGSLPEILLRFPEAKVVGNRQTTGMLQGYYAVKSEQILEVKDGDTLDLGSGKILTFHTIPMVHWPETMVTYLADEQVLFSGDAFGTFGALKGELIDDTNRTETIFNEMHRYYACIVAKYGQQVQGAFAKLKNLNIKYICSTHGPIWHEQINRVLETYHNLSTQQTKPGVVIAYASMYGHTESMARRAAERINEKGVKAIMHDVARTDMSFVLRDIWTYKGLIVASPTYNGDTFPPVTALLHALELRGLKDRMVACLGDYTWAPAACRKIEEFFDRMKLNKVSAPLQVKMNPTDADLKAIDAIADAMADAITK